MRLKNIAVAAAVVAILIVGAFFFGRAGDTTTLSERRVADIAAATVDLRIKPLTGDIEALGRDTKALKEGFVKYNEAIDNKFKQQGDVLANIKQLLESKGPTSPPAAATPSTPAMSALEQQRRTQVQAECLPEDQRVDVKDDLGDEAFNALIAHCKANKMAKQRMVSPPPAAGHPQVAQGDPQAEPEAGLVDEESDAQAPGQPRPQQVGYGYGPQPYGAPRHGMGPGYGAPHPGMHRGHPRCPPGSNFNPQFGKCIGTRLHHIPLHPEAQAAFPTCRTIETRLVWKGGRLVEQQRGIACRRPAGVYQ